MQLVSGCGSALQEAWDALSATFAATHQTLVSSYEGIHSEPTNPHKERCLARRGRQLGAAHVAGHSTARGGPRASA